MNDNIMQSNIINVELKQVSDWLSINKLSLNANTTKYMLFHFPQRNIADIELTLKIENHYIERVEDFNFLGTTIHETLDWTPHIDKVANKISQTLGILNKLKHVLPKYILKTMYNALVVPHFNYSILLWGFNSNRLRIITCSKYNAHTEPLLKYINLLK